MEPSTTDSEGQQLDRAELVFDASVAAAAGALAAASGDPATAGLIAGFTALLGQAFRHDRLERIKQFGRAAFPDRALEMVERLNANERLRALFSQALRAAADTHLASKRVALGRALRRGVLAEDDAAVDDEALLIRALSVVDAPEIRLLEMLKPPLWEGGTSESRLTNDEMLKRLGGAGHAVEGIIAVLEGQGLAKGFTGGYGSPPEEWTITSFGSRLLEWLRDAEDTPEA